MDDVLAAALVAGVVSVLVGLISFYATQAKVAHETLQNQFRDVLKKRLEAYPDLWGIHIKYETNWTLEGKIKDRGWAEEYLTALNKFNAVGGLFFSQALYEKFGELRKALVDAIDQTQSNEQVSNDRQLKIRLIVYGDGDEPGMSTHVKDDLGSYRDISLQRRVGQGRRRARQKWVPQPRRSKRRLGH